MENEESLLELLAKRIVHEKNLASICDACRELFSAVLKRNARNLVFGTENEGEVKEKCRLLRESLEHCDIAEKLSDEDLCKLAHIVVKIKLQRGI